MTSTAQRIREPRPRTLLFAGLVFLAALVATGCDTTAKVSFPSRSFGNVETSGMTAPRGACGNIGANSNMQTKLRFVMLADDDTAIRPTSKGGTPLDSGPVSLTEQNNFTPLGGGAVFEAPDLSCAAGKPAGGGLESSDTWKGAVSTYDGTCSQRFTCEKRVDASNSGLARCSASTGYSVQGVDHVANLENDQVFGVLAENTPSLVGQLRDDLNNQVYYDADGDGTAETLTSRYATRSRGTDSGNERSVAMGAIRSHWIDVHDEARESAGIGEGRRKTHFGLWTFSGNPNPTRVSEQSSNVSGGPWVGAGNTEKVEDLIEAYKNDVSVPTDGKGNVLQATWSLLNPQVGDGSPFAGRGNQGVEKTLVVFADGPPEQHPGAFPGTTADEVIEQANKANVRIFIVHLDPRLPSVTGDSSFGPEDVLDDFEYYSSTQQPESCSKDGVSCAAHEVCRDVRGYHLTGGEVSGSDGTHREGKFCMPRRRPDGRTGPIAMYSKIACATGGGYQYVKHPQALEHAMGWLPKTMDGLWEATLGVNALQNGIYPRNSSMRFQGRFEVTAGTTTRTIEMSQTAGDGYDPNMPGSGDNRSVLFTGGENASQ